jgi:hypothetical protein
MFREFNVNIYRMHFPKDTTLRQKKRQNRKHYLKDLGLDGMIKLKQTQWNMVYKREKN